MDEVDEVSSHAGWNSAPIGQLLVAFEKGVGVETQALRRNATPLTYTTESGSRASISAR